VIPWAHTRHRDPTRANPCTDTELPRHPQARTERYRLLHPRPDQTNSATASSPSGRSQGKDIDEPDHHAKYHTRAPQSPNSTRASASSPGAESRPPASRPQTRTEPTPSPIPRGPLAHKIEATTSSPSAPSRAPASTPLARTEANLSPKLSSPRTHSTETTASFPSAESQALISPIRSRAERIPPPTPKSATEPPHAHRAPQVQEIKHRHRRPEPNHPESSRRAADTSGRPQGHRDPQVPKGQHRHRPETKRPAAGDLPRATRCLPHRLLKLSRR